MFWLRHYVRALFQMPPALSSERKMERFLTELAYATHSIERGVNIKALQEAMGHVNMETTAGYCHATALSVPSPLDSLRLAHPDVGPMSGKTKS